MSATSIDNASFAAPATGLLLPVAVLTLQAIQKLRTAAEQSLKLDWEQCTLLINLAITEGRPLRVSDLAAATDFSKSVTSQRLSRLQKAGFIAYQDDESDRRIVSALLTEAGFEHVRAIVDMGQTVLMEIFEVQGDARLETLDRRFIESPYMTQSVVLSRADSSPEARFDAVAWFWQAYNSFYRALQRSLGEADVKLSLVSLLILFQLKNIGSEMSMGELTRSLLVEKDSVSRASRQLLDKRYVARRRDTLDRRVVFLDLTTDGNELLLGLLPSILESISSLQGFSDPVILESLSVGSADYVRRVRA